jgi:UDP-N-acetylglucosamine:LPS N-acetylglucosamine transferase
MKILYLTFYYEPDLCAGSFRNTPLVKEIARKLEETGEVSVVTTMPNRYSSLKQKAQAFEKNGNLTIRRVAIPAHKSGFLDQILSFRKYFNEVRNITKDESYDLVFASTSRLFTGYLGYTISKRKNIPLYLDVRDLFVDTMSEVLKPKVLKLLIIRLLKKLEKKVFAHASHINLISEGFRKEIAQNMSCTFSYFTNGIDNEFVELGKKTVTNDPSTPAIITYAGNIGEGQGLHKVIPEAANLLGKDFSFKIIGDGGAYQKLKEQLKAKHVKNVELIKPVPRKEVLDFYADSDYLFLHLNDYKAFEKVLPSKIFEYAATNKPIIAGVSGFSLAFIKKNIEDCILFEPCNAVMMAEILKEFKRKKIDRKDFIKKFKRNNLMSLMADSIIEVCENGKDINHR